MSSSRFDSSSSSSIHHAFDNFLLVLLICLLLLCSALSGWRTNTDQTVTTGASSSSSSWFVDHHHYHSSDSSSSSIEEEKEVISMNIMTSKNDDTRDSGQGLGVDNDNGDNNNDVEDDDDDGTRDSGGQDLLVVEVDDRDNGSSDDEKKKKKKICYVTQWGHDGFGHQLHGMMSVMALNGLEHPFHTDWIFRFDADTPRRPFEFAHGLNQKEDQQAKEFLSTSMEMMMTQNHSSSTLNGPMPMPTPLTPTPRQRLYVHEWSNMSSCQSNVTYELDSMWKLIPPFCGPLHLVDWKKQFVQQQQQIAQDYFATNLFHIVSNINNNNNNNISSEEEDDDDNSSILFTEKTKTKTKTTTMAVHIRLGDSGVRGSNPLHRLLPKLVEQIQHHQQQNNTNSSFLQLSIDTDDVETVQELLASNGIDVFGSNNNTTNTANTTTNSTTTTKIQIYGPGTSNGTVLEALARFVKADIFYSAHSSLSLAAVWMRPNEKSSYVPREVVQSYCGLLVPLDQVIDWY